MRYVTNCPISLRGDRIEKGIEVDLTAEEAANFGPDVSPVEAAAEEETPAAEPAIEDMTLGQLKAKAETLGLSKSGSKADLQERITLHLQGNEGGDAPGAEETEQQERGEESSGQRGRRRSGR